MQKKRVTQPVKKGHLSAGGEIISPTQSNLSGAIKAGIASKRKIEDQKRKPIQLNWVNKK